VRHIAPALADAGWDVVVYGRSGVTLDTAQADDRIVSRITRGIESRSLSTLTYGLTAVLDVVFRRVDVALVMNVANGYWLPLLRLGGIPVAVNVDGIEWERAKWGRLAKLVFLWGAKLTALTANELISDAVAIADYWKKKFGRSSVFIPYGAEEVEPLPVPLGLEHRRYVLVVARFVPENTIVEFFQAVSSFADERDVVIVGSSGYGGELDAMAKRLAEQHRRVRWLGHVADDALLYALWQHAGVYFHGHSVGGTNPALVQAMALGAPILALDTVYNREVLGAGHQHFVQADGSAIAGEWGGRTATTRGGRSARATRRFCEACWGPLGDLDTAGDAEGLPCQDPQSPPRSRGRRGRQPHGATCVIRECTDPGSCVGRCRAR
jgi:glycosyltransferase involved in cell wall biosynthesis